MPATSPQDVHTAAQRHWLKNRLCLLSHSKEVPDSNQDHVFIKEKEYIEQISQKHPNAGIYLTGQALAGAVCAYVATEQPAVKSPSPLIAPIFGAVWHLRFSRKRKEGQYTRVLTEYIQPSHYVGLLNRHDHGVGQVIHRAATATRRRPRIG
ncbi:hypothetical protein ACEQPO_30395 [Bacillus sp. SL00103]